MPDSPISDLRPIEISGPPEVVGWFLDSSEATRRSVPEILLRLSREPDSVWFSAFSEVVLGQVVSHGTVLREGESFLRVYPFGPQARLVETALTWASKVIDSVNGLAAERRDYLDETNLACEKWWQARQQEK